MSKIWSILMLGAGAAALLSGRAGQAAKALLDSGNRAVTLLMTLLVSMTMWSGLMEILSRSGDANRLGRVFRRWMRPLFPALADEQAWNAMTVNLSANLLGLGNAATPAGIEAAKRLSRLGEPGMRALAMLLVMDQASLQLIPTTVITLRQTYGAQDPADIWGMTLLVSGVSMALAVLLMWLCQRGGKAYERMDRRSHCRPGDIHHSPGRHDGQ
ncbi:MAG: hypothetical protein IJB81_02320 [Clostridia bacterium]|nr:hypothetical protein [Clostridia bacterium]